jgi:type I restriction enzyme, S subunit
MQRCQEQVWTCIGNLKLPIPPLSEQTQIINHIKTETATIDTAIAKTLKEIELIKEYKEAMIAEAVMGKINFNKQANK